MQLRPSALDDFGLPAALEPLTFRMAQRSGLDIRLQAAVGERAFDSDRETAIYRIVQRP